MRSIRIAISGCVLVASLAACSDDSKSDQTTGTTGTTATTGTEGGGTTTAASIVDDIVAAAQANLAAYNENPTTLLGVPEETLKSLPEPGSKIYFLTAPGEVAGFSSDLKAAAEALGMELTVIDQVGTPEGVTSAWDQVVADKPAVVIDAGFPPAMYQNQFDEYVAGGGIVLGYGIGVPDLPEGVVFNLVGLDATTVEEAGTLMADYVISDANGSDAQVAFFSAPYDIVQKEQKAFEDRLAECSNCSIVSNINPDLATIGTALPAQVVSILQQNPDVKYAVFAFGSMSIGVSNALKAAGIDVQIVSQAGDGAFNVGAVRDGDQAFDIAYGYTFNAYRLVDAAARALAGQDVGTPATPLRILTPDTIGSVEFREDGNWLAYPDILAEFKKAWGI